MSEMKMLQSRRVLASLLKAVAVFMGGALLLAGLGPVNWFAQYIVGIEPALAAFAPKAVIYVNLGFVPVYGALFLAWQVFDAIGRDESFSYANGKRLKGAAVLALMEVVWLAIGFGWFSHEGAISPFGLIAFVGLMLLGLSVAIICYALAQLIDQAAALKEEADLTV